jgi:error-prone DNA polymerase
MLARRRGARAYGGQGARDCADHRLGVALRGSAQTRRARDEPRGLRGLEPLDQPGAARQRQGQLPARARDLENALDGCVMIWLPGEGRELRIQPRGTGALAARALRRALMARRGTADERLRCAPLRAARGAGKSAGHSASRRRRRAHASARPPRPARRADGDSLEYADFAAGFALFPNGERSLRSLSRLRELYPAPLLSATLEIAERCRFKLDELRYEYPEEIVPAHATPTSHLRDLTERGALKRWPGGRTKRGARWYRARAALDRRTQV